MQLSYRADRDRQWHDAGILPLRQAQGQGRMTKSRRIESCLPPLVYRKLEAVRFRRVLERWQTRWCVVWDLSAGWGRNVVY